MELVATCLWPASPEVVLALDERFGLPVDSYVNGSQTWLVDVAGAAITLEWRLHPVARYRTPAGCSHYDVWELVVGAISSAPDAPIVLGDETRTLDSLWDGLECFVAHGDDVEPATLARLGAEMLGIAPEASGLVDHRQVADAWERRGRDVSIVQMLRNQLGAKP
ncbi:MAG: hypothetical protein U0V73_00945 [Acidimicrobiia bacterium]